MTMKGKSDKQDVRDGVSACSGEHLLLVLLVGQIGESRGLKRDQVLRRTKVGHWWTWRL